MWSLFSYEGWFGINVQHRVNVEMARKEFDTLVGFIGYKQK